MDEPAYKANDKQMHFKLRSKKDHRIANINHIRSGFWVFFSESLIQIYYFYLGITHNNAMEATKKSKVMKLSRNLQDQFSTFAHCRRYLLMNIHIYVFFKAHDQCVVVENCLSYILKKQGGSNSYFIDHPAFFTQKLLI